MFQESGVAGLSFSPPTGQGSCRRSDIAKDNRRSPAIAAVLQLKPQSCRWPIGHPKDSDFRFCGALRLPQRSYCAEHDSLARAASA